MDWHLLLTPWNLGGSLFGLTLGVAVLATVLVHRRQIGVALLNATRWLFSPVGFFGLVIVVFMVISVLESGAFFSLNITHGAVFGLLGYALALGFDLVSVVCMIARLNAERLRDERLSIASLFGANLKEGEKRVKRKEEKWHRQSTKQYTKQRFKQLV